MKYPTPQKTTVSFLLFACLLINGCSYKGEEHEATSPKVLNKICFGSCASQGRDQPIWDTVITKQPDLFLFIGDNIYGDTEDMALMRKKYAQLKAKPGYQRLTESTPILATWDDHDYGVNDGGSEYPMKAESAKEHLDFFNVPQDSPRRSRDGIYGAKTFGPKGQRVQVILLDTRSFRSSPMLRNKLTKEEKKAKNIVGWYSPHTDINTTILGAEQWSWLEKQLKQKADLRIIASSIQVISYEKRMECWGNFPHERQRLFDLIKKTKANNALFISGDVHFSEISMDPNGPYPLYDFTSSGITHASIRWAGTPNLFRVGDAYAQPNFGLINIDWKNKSLGLETISVSGKTEIQKEISFNELKIKRK